MKKLYFMAASLLALLPIGDSLAAEDISLTLVAGNCRKPGGVKPSTAKLVEQDKADFTHSQSFPGRVISVDICPLQSNLNYPHLTIDLAHASPDTILSELKNVHPTRMFFEWFPSCLTQSPGKNMTPLLLPALKNAFAILSPDGGELIIDHHPYSLCLPNTSQEAFTGLREKIKINSEHLSKAIPSFDRIKEPGIISHFLQTADPFTMNMCRQERQEIRDCLMFRVKNNNSPYNNAQCQFIKDQDISKVASGLLSIFKMGNDEMLDLMALISNSILYSTQGVKEEAHGYWDLFEQHYYMKTRGPLILDALRNIGFSVEDNAIQYYERNPYNKRKHAWLITAKKPRVLTKDSI